MKQLFLSLLWGILGGIITIAGVHHFLYSDNPFLEYYTTENAVAVSPHDLRMEMDKWANDTIIVDLRSAPEFAAEHIRGAINIPWIANDKNATEQEKRIITEFRKLPKDKRIIVHCYTHYCMLAKHVGLMLAKEWINVHELNIGWNEWRYQWDLWNGEGTSKTIDVNNYLEWTKVSHSWSTINASGSIQITPCTADGLSGC